jgi:hypothetical protein
MAQATFLLLQSRPMLENRPGSDEGNSRPGAEEAVSGVVCQLPSVADNLAGTSGIDRNTNHDKD